jgi:Tol biopolymer transport system component
MPVLSADGTRIAFDSAATNLVPGPQNRHDHVYVRTLAPPEIVRASAAAGGEIAAGANLAFHGGLALSGDGSIVVFNSHASNLVPGDSNGRIDVFARDLARGTIERISVSSSGAQGNGDSLSPAVSGSGRFVAFASDADDLVPGDGNAARDVFLRDRRSGITTRLSLAAGGAEWNGASSSPALSASGRFVAFASEATNLAGGAASAPRAVFVLDRESGGIEVASAGAGGGAPSDSPALDASGSRIAFVSGSPLAVFVRDRAGGAPVSVSTAPSGGPADDESGGWGIALSGDGSCVAFSSLASNLVAGDDDGRSDLFVVRLDRPAATLASERVE